MQTDLEFHDVIMRASGNRLGRAVVRAIHSEARASDRYNGFPRGPTARRPTSATCRIYDRIVAADPEGAAAAMSEHILGSWFARRRKPESRPADPPTD